MPPPGPLGHRMPQVTLPMAPFPVAGSTIRGTANGILAAGRQVRDSAAAAERTHVGAQQAVLGDLAPAVEAAPAPMRSTAAHVEGSVRLAAGAVAWFASGVDTYNGEVNAINADYDRAKQKDGLLTPLTTIAMRLRAARAIATLDGEAAYSSTLLAAGPSPETLSALDARGVLPPPTLVPLDDAESVVSVDGDRAVVKGTSGADHVQVKTFNGVTYVRKGVLGDDGTITYSQWEAVPEGKKLVIDTGDGNDVVEADPNVTRDLYVATGSGNDLYYGGGHTGRSRGGSGNDVIDLGDGNDVAYGGDGNDRILGGRGNDTIDGQGGNDQIDGGDGIDSVYGGRGDDQLSGGAGQDHLEGGSGRDELHGGDGNDSVSGGRDDDLVFGDAGDDKLFGGRGDDDLVGGDGNDTGTRDKFFELGDVETQVYVPMHDNAGSKSVRLHGNSPDENERLDSDLEFLRSTKSGRDGLLALDLGGVGGHHKVDITPYNNETKNSDPLYWMQHGQGPGGNWDVGNDDNTSTVNYATMYARDDQSPAHPVSLFHELSHAQDDGFGKTEGEYTETYYDANGNVLATQQHSNAEINSVGVDVDGDGDYETAPRKYDRLFPFVKYDHPSNMTENAMREETGFAQRGHYGGVDGAAYVKIEFVDADGKHQTVVRPTT